MRDCLEFDVICDIDDFVVVENVGIIGIYFGVFDGLYVDVVVIFFVGLRNFGEFY